MASTRQQSNGKVKKADTSHGRSAAGAAAPGARLASAFEAVEKFPAPTESRARGMQAATAETARVGEVVEAFQADFALTVAVLRFPNGPYTGPGISRRPPQVRSPEQSRAQA